MSTPVPSPPPSPPPDDDLDDSRFRAAIAGIMADIRGQAPARPAGEGDVNPPGGPTGW